MRERTPDIEIYLKRVDRQLLLDWLGTLFDVTDSREAGTTLQLKLQRGDATLDCAVVENAARGGYTSLWFKQNLTPWDNDEACAREAFEQFDVEVRCSRGGWENGQSDDGAWLRFTDKGVSEVNWRT